MYYHLPRKTALQALYCLLPIPPKRGMGRKVVRFAVPLLLLRNPKGVQGMGSERSGDNAPDFLPLKRYE